MQTIDLPTVQHVTISYEAATLGERCLAILIDLAIVGGSYFLIIFRITRLFSIEWEGFTGVALGFFLPLAIFHLYHFLFELLRHGQSWGKKIMKIQVVRADGDAAAAGDYLLRSMLYFVDLFASMGILGGLLIHASPKRQRLGDILAGTVVIKIKASNRYLLKDILKISSLEDYEPSFPAVRQFSESDMLLIKSTLNRAQRYNNEINQQLVRDLAHQIASRLELLPQSLPPKSFLQTLIKDYIVLTR